MKSREQIEKLLKEARDVDQNTCCTKTLIWVLEWVLEESDSQEP